MEKILSCKSILEKIKQTCIYAWFLSLIFEFKQKLDGLIMAFKIADKSDGPNFTFVYCNERSFIDSPDPSEIGVYSPLGHV